MANLALQKEKEKNAKLKRSNAERARKRKNVRETILVEGMGQLGEATASAGMAVTDAKFAAGPGEMATFGDSAIPIGPVVGLGMGLASLALIKPAPAAASFIGRAGTQMVWLGVYNGVRGKAEDYFEGG